VTDPAKSPLQPTATEVFERYLPFIAVGGMVVTFLVMPQPFAVAFIGGVWLIATRLSRSRTFLGLTLTQALAWAATIVIALLALAFALYTLGAPTA
jgi:hypothetical protein